MEIIKNGTFPAFPEFASWESTLECNMSCKHCGLACGPNKKNARGRELTAPEARVMLEKLREFGVRNIVISGGEFLLRADSYELAAQALDTFDSVRIISNGWLGSDILRHLEILPNASKLVLSLSIDGPERIHDEIRRPGSFKRTTSLLKAVSPITRTAITTVMNCNFVGLEELFEILCDCNIAVWALQIGLPAGRMKRNEFIGFDRSKVLAAAIRNWQNRANEKIEVVPDDCFGYCHPMRKAYPWTGCPAAKKLITILSNGDITGCPTSSERFGNIITDDLSEVWQSVQINAYRSSLPLCTSCSNNRCFRGCRAVQKTIGHQICF